MPASGDRLYTTRLPSEWASAVWPRSSRVVASSWVIIAGGADVVAGAEPGAVLDRRLDPALGARYRLVADDRGAGIAAGRQLRQVAVTSGGTDKGRPDHTGRRPGQCRLGRCRARAAPITPPDDFITKSGAA